VLARRGRTNHGADRHFSTAAVELARSLGVGAVVGFNRMGGLDICYSAENCFAAKAAEERSWFYRLTPRYRTYRRLEEAVFGNGASTKLLLLSDRQLESYKRHYALDPSRVHLLPPAIARDRARTAEFASARRAVRAELGIEDENYALLALGSAFWTKGLDRTLQAIAHLPDSVRLGVRFYVAGRGSEKELARLARQKGVEEAVRFLGVRDDVGRLLAGADLLVHPARDECTGTAILEAIVAGLPVMCTANCGFSRHVTEAAAGVVLPDPFDGPTMAKELARMLDRQRLAEWSANGLRYAQSADLYRGTEIAAELIERLAARLGRI
jgi:UDP-glucose:(heptosyl)LPS alpha-1,3-glucosyltransferase